MAKQPARTAARSAGSGRFVTKAAARADPAHTIVETLPAPWRVFRIGEKVHIGSPGGMAVVLPEWVVKAAARAGTGLLGERDIFPPRRRRA